MSQNATYTELSDAFQAIAGLATLTAEDSYYLRSTVNTAANRAYDEFWGWPRFLVVGEERTVSGAQTIPYVQAGKDTIGEFIKVHKKQPFVDDSVTEYEFYVDSTGAKVLSLGNTTPASLWVTYKKEYAPAYDEDSTDIPREFFDYILYSCLAAFYSGDGQVDKAAVNMNFAQDALDGELQRIASRSAQTKIWGKIRTHLNNQRR